MMRKEQQKDLDIRKQVDKAAMTAAADMEGHDMSTDPHELERIRKRQAGTQVTVETFNSWKKNFDIEMKTGKATVFSMGAGTGASAELERLSGKQLFLQSKGMLDEEAEAMIAAGEAEIIDESTQDGEGQERDDASNEGDDDENERSDDEAADAVAIDNT